MLHLVGGLVGERDGEDLERADTTITDEVGDASGEHLGLARPGAGHDEQRPVAVGGRLPLDGIEPRQMPLAAVPERTGLERAGGVQRGRHPTKLQGGDSLRQAPLDQFTAGGRTAAHTGMPMASVSER